MSRALPKGHLSCLSNSFRYTLAADTNVASTFARIKPELREQETHGSASRERVEYLAVHRGRPFPIARVESARGLLRAGGLRPTPRLVHASEVER